MPLGSGLPGWGGRYSCCSLLRPNWAVLTLHTKCVLNLLIIVEQDNAVVYTSVSWSGLLRAFSVR
jgi:hypothetical protein